MNLLTSPHITWQSRNTFINIYSIITKKLQFLVHDRTWASIQSLLQKKCLLDYDTCLIERSRRTSNPAGRSSRISNSAGRLLCLTWFELFSQLATPGRSYARKIRNHSCGGPVEWKNDRTREYLRSERLSRIRPVFAYFFKSFSDCSNNASSNPYGY